MDRLSRYTFSEAQGPGGGADAPNRDPVELVAQMLRGERGDRAHTSSATGAGPREESRPQSPPPRAACRASEGQPDSPWPPLGVPRALPWPCGIPEIPMNSPQGSASWPTHDPSVTAAFGSRIGPGAPAVDDLQGPEGGASGARHMGSSSPAIACASLEQRLGGGAAQGVPVPLLEQRQRLMLLRMQEREQQQQWWQLQRLRQAQQQGDLNRQHQQQQHELLQQQQQQRRQLQQLVLLTRLAGNNLQGTEDVPLVRPQLDGGASHGFRNGSPLRKTLVGPGPGTARSAQCLPGGPLLQAGTSSAHTASASLGAVPQLCTGGSPSLNPGGREGSRVPSLEAQSRSRSSLVYPRDSSHESQEGRSPLMPQEPQDSLPMPSMVAQDSVLRNSMVGDCIPRNSLLRDSVPSMGRDSLLENSMPHRKLMRLSSLETSETPNTAPCGNRSQTALELGGGGPGAPLRRAITSASEGDNERGALSGALGASGSRHAQVCSPYAVGLSGHKVGSRQADLPSELGHVPGGAKDSSDELRGASGETVERERKRGPGKRETAKRFRKRYSQRLAELESQLEELQGSCKDALASLQAAGAHISVLERTNRRLELDVMSLQKDAANSGIVIRQDVRTGRVVAERVPRGEQTLAQPLTQPLKRPLPQSVAQPLPQNLSQQPLTQTQGQPARPQDARSASATGAVQQLPGAQAPQASGSVQPLEAVRGGSDPASGDGEVMGLLKPKALSQAPLPPAHPSERYEELVPDMNLQSLLCSFQEDGQAFLAGL